jgi:hypothetical protein
MTPPTDRPAGRSVYRVRRAYFARALGRTAVVASVLVLLVVLCLAVSAPGVLVGLFVVLAAIALTVVAVMSVSLMLPPTLLQLDDVGFRVSKRYSSGPRDGSWFAVTSAASQEGPDGWVLIVQHESGEHTAVPLSLVDVDAVAVEKDVRRRLDAAHGYRGIDE